MDAFVPPAACQVIHSGRSRTGRESVAILANFNHDSREICRIFGPWPIHFESVAANSLCVFVVLDEIKN